MKQQPKINSSVRKILTELNYRNNSKVVNEIIKPQINFNFHFLYL